MNYLIGIDGGGSKTNAVVTKENGEIICGIQAGASNFQRVGVAGVRTVAEEILSQLRGKMKISRQEIDHWALGLAGAGREEDQNAVRQAVISLGFEDRVSVQSDAYIALMGAFAGNAGVIVIAGTGSICFGLDEKGALHRSGGWGYLLGDEGSGFFIGHQAILAALKDHDSRGEPTALKHEVETALHLSSIDQIVRKMYIENKVQKEDIAGLAPLVFRCAKDGDTAAKKIVAKTAEEIAKMIAAVGKKMGREGNRLDVAHIGSVFKQKDVLLPQIIDHLTQKFSGITIDEPRFEPAIGAVIWAFRQNGLSLSDEVLANLSQKYEMV